MTKADEPTPDQEHGEGADSQAEAGAEGEAGPGDDELEGLRTQAEENWNKYLRTVAELDNVRKRAARDVENARKYGLERLAGELLPVRDSLEAGIGAAEEAGDDAAALIEGAKATLKLLDGALAKFQVELIDPEGEPFDPERHEAMSVIPNGDVEPNTVVTVVQKGFAIHDRLLRPARVLVSKEPE